MGTRGFLGIRNNKKLLFGKYNGHDSYYSYLGEQVIKKYYSGWGNELLECGEEGDEDNKGEFLQDGLYCEFAYVYNQENDTLEIYRGFFHHKQNFKSLRNKKEYRKAQVIDKLKEPDEGGYFCHLIMIIDRKKHTEEDVKKAFEEYQNKEEELYPERDVIDLELNANYVNLV